MEIEVSSARASGVKIKQQQILHNDGETERHQKWRVHPLVHNPVHQVILNDKSNEKHRGNDENKGQQRADLENGQGDKAEITGQDDEIPVGEVDDAHDPEDHGHPDPDNAVKAPQKEAVHNRTL